MDIAEICRQHSHRLSIPSDQRGGLYCLDADRGDDGAEGSEAFVGLEILHERAPARAQRSAARRIKLRRDLFEEVQEGLFESLVGRDHQDFASGIKELNITLVRPKQFEGNAEYLIQPGMEVACLPEPRARLVELFQRR